MAEERQAFQLNRNASESCLERCNDQFDLVVLHETAFNHRRLFLDGMAGYGVDVSGVELLR